MFEALKVDTYTWAAFRATVKLLLFGEETLATAQKWDLKETYFYGQCKADEYF